MTAEVGVEAEGLHDGQVSLDGEHGSSNSLLFGEDLTTTTIEDTIDTTDCVLGALNFDEVDGLLHTRGSQETGGIGDTAAHWDDLSTTTMNGVGVKL